VKKEVVDIQPDLNSPIEVTERTEVMIKGKKCVLMQNPETKQLCAYPILPAAGRVGRSCGKAGSPLYNCSGWLGIKHKVTYYREAGYRLTLMAVTAGSVSSLTEGYIL